jgi:uncharacterized membrane protein YqaE (UPF0057 family)
MALSDVLAHAAALTHRVSFATALSDVLACAAALTHRVSFATALSDVLAYAAAPARRVSPAMALTGHRTLNLLVKPFDLLSEIVCALTLPTALGSFDTFLSGRRTLNLLVKPIDLLSKIVCTLMLPMVLTSLNTFPSASISLCELRSLCASFCTFVSLRIASRGGTRPSRPCSPCDLARPSPRVRQPTYRFADADGHRVLQPADYIVLCPWDKVFNAMLTLLDYIPLSRHALPFGRHSYDKLPSLDHVGSALGIRGAFDAVGFARSLGVRCGA